MATFPGFPKQTLTFFRQLAANNDRAWFNAHKETFEAVVKSPMIELVTLVADDLRAFAADYVPDKPEKSIYRIYRDTRFSKDKTPYKTHIAAHFQHRRVGKNLGAGFYFAVSHESVEIAGGMYMPGPDQLRAVRGVLLKDHAKFAKLCGDKSLVKAAGELLGEKLTRVPKVYPADSPAAEWLKRKQFYFDISLPAKAALDKTIRKEIASRFRKMQPMVDYLNDALLADLGEEAIPKRPEPMF